MRREDEKEILADRIGELQLDRRVVRRGIDQSGICETDIDAARQRGDGRVCAFDLAVGSDGFDPLQNVAVGELCARDVTQNRSVLFDRALELVEASQAKSCRRTAAATDLEKLS